MNNLLKRITNLTKPSYNLGTTYLRQLIALQENALGQGQGAAEAQAVANYGQTHNLTPEQVEGLFDILGANIDAVKQLSGTGFDRYQTQLDYKIRNSGFVTGGTVEGKQALLTHSEDKLTYLWFEWVRRCQLIQSTTKVDTFRIA